VSNVLNCGKQAARTELPFVARSFEFGNSFLYTCAIAQMTEASMSRSDILAIFDRHGVLPTPQRLEVAEVILARPQHLSADQIIERLREAGSKVSKATVYNTLNLFGDRGIVREVMVDPVRKYYDSTTRPHHHFYNVDTGELNDIPDDAVEFARLPALPEGTAEEGVEVLIRVRTAEKS
jgi:Fur family transcriptional regulator, iron response regulator